MTGLLGWSKYSVSAVQDACQSRIAAEYRADGISAVNLLTRRLTAPRTPLMTSSQLIAK
jgi:hypothetical protein